MLTRTPFTRESTRTVCLPDGSELGAEVYCVPEEKAAAILSDEPWTLAWFERHALDDFWAATFGR